MESTNMGILSKIVVFGKYGKHLPNENRREVWEEISTRVRDMHLGRYPQVENDIRWAFDRVIQYQAVPSMRSSQFAGPAIDKNEAKIYNCSFIAIQSVKDFSEVAFLCLSGVGVGFSVQERHISKLPAIKTPKTSKKFLIGDSIEGWADAFRALFKAYLEGGSYPLFDYTDIRPEGTPLKTSGGYAPGSQILKKAINHIDKILSSKKVGEQLTSIEVHDIVCFIGQCAASGGIRRCLPSFYSVETTKGLKNIKNVKVGDYVVQNGQEYEVKNFFVQGVQDVYEIFTPTGSHISTLNHKWFVYDYVQKTKRFATTEEIKENPTDFSFLKETKDYSITLEDGTLLGGYSVFPIIKVEYYGQEETFDIEVDVVHSFNAMNEKSGFVSISHNSALISLFDYTDDDMLTCKGNFQVEIVNGGFHFNSQKNVHTGVVKYRNSERMIELDDWSFNQFMETKTLPWWHFENQRSQANNSVVLHRNNGTITKEYFDSLFKKIEDSNAGEPGFFWTNDYDWGTNPSLRAGTKVLTTEGIFPIEQLEDKEFQVKNLNGEISNAKCWLSGRNKQLWKITLKGGKSYYATPEHEWAVWENDKYVKVKTPNVKVGDKFPILRESYLFNGTKGSYNDGFIFGGTNPQNLGTFIFQEASEEYRKGFIDGLFSSLAYFETHIHKIRISLGNSEVLEQLQELLGFYGVSASIIKNKIVDQYDSSIHLLEELFISDSQSVKHFKELFKISNKEKQEILNSYKFKTNPDLKQIEVIGIELTDIKEDVWDISVQDATHCFQISNCITGNCAEIALVSREFCNLTEVNISNVTSQQDLEDRVKCATIIGTLQAGYSNFHYLSSKWKQNCKNEALLGVSFTGICDNDYTKYDWDKVSKLALQTNEEIAGKIGIKPAHRIGCIKPSGNTSSVLNTASGIHARHSKYYIRNVRFKKTEPIAQYLKSVIPELVADEIGNDLNYVVSIPMKSPETSIFRDEPALNILERVKFFHENWIKPTHRQGANTHNVSVTINVKPGEWEEIREWCWDNKEHYTAISLFPFDSGTYIQAPFQECDETTYLEMAKYVRDIDLKNVIEYSDNTNLNAEQACAGGACEVSFI